MSENIKNEFYPSYDNPGAEYEVLLSVYDQINDRTRQIFYTAETENIARGGDYGTPQGRGALFSALSDYASERYPGGQTYKEEMVRYIKDCRESIPAGDIPDGADLFFRKNDSGGIEAVLKKDGREIATAGDNKSGDEYYAEIYCETDEEYRGRGFAEFLVNVICGRLADEGYKGIEYITESDNLPSVRVAEKCGFKKETDITYYIVYFAPEEK